MTLSTAHNCIQVLTERRKRACFVPNFFSYLNIGFPCCWGCRSPVPQRNSPKTICSCASETPWQREMQDANQSSEGATHSLPGRWVACGLEQEGYVIRTKQIQALHMLWPSRSQVRFVQARGQGNGEPELQARQGLGEADSVYQKCQGAVAMSEL